MSLLQRVARDDFRQAFRDYDRLDNFSLLGLDALYEYYDDLSEDLGEDITIDVIGICCEWCEYTKAELVEAYGVSHLSLVDDHLVIQVEHQHTGPLNYPSHYSFLVSE